MAEETLIDKQWVDIIAPPPPESNALLWWLVILVLGLIVSAALVYFWQKRPYQTARRRISRLSKQNHSGNINSKTLLKQLERILCNFYGVSHLTQTSLQDARWPIYQRRLKQACYQAQMPDARQTQSLLAEARSFVYRPDKI